jgi:carbohydrate-selective porin OprB
LWYQQGFFDHKLTVKLGQVAPVNEFGATDFFDILFNDELGYAPNAIFNTREPFSPAGKPGVIITGDLSAITPGLYAKTGVFTAYDDPYHPDSNGVDYGDDFNHGIAAAFEIGYKEQNTSYPGVYKLGTTWVTRSVRYTKPVSTGELYDMRLQRLLHGGKDGLSSAEYRSTTTDPKDMKATRPARRSIPNGSRPAPRARRRAG